MAIGNAQPGVITVRQRRAKITISLLGCLQAPIEKTEKKIADTKVMAILPSRWRYMNPLEVGVTFADPLDEKLAALTDAGVGKLASIWELEEPVELQPKTLDGR
ncbi:hypothetical protein MUK42_04181 [Musa troglodytarum]|uniref:Uncharacterized protein n=1 Tax=Musa troglodytarum TaxID=320322 RepID=A0A9E7GLD2_9LILI|nr:hypothetical protein MUK42_04181 [Musa troglodytarum]